MNPFVFSTPDLIGHVRGFERRKDGSVRATLDFVYRERVIFTHVDNWSDATVRMGMASQLHDLTGLITLELETDLARLELMLGGGILSAQYRNEVWAERNFRFRTAREVAEATPPEVDWVARGIVARGSLTELAGKIKAAGKTTFATHLCHQVVGGLPFLDACTAQGPVVYLTEQGESSFREALRRAELLENDDFHVLFWHDVVGVSWPEVVGGAVDEAMRIGAVLLVVDTLPQFAGVRGDAENNAGEALAAMEPLQEAAAKHNLGVIAVRHERKAGGDVGDSGRGSSAFGGAVDIVLALRRPEGNHGPSVRELRSLSRFDETPNGLIIELVGSTYQVLGDQADVALAEARNALLEVMPTTPGTALRETVLREKAGLKRTTSQRALEALVADEIVCRIGEGKKGDAYRFFRPEEGGSDDVDESENSGILSAQTSLLYGQKGFRAESDRPNSDEEAF